MSMSLSKLTFFVWCLIMCIVTSLLVAEYKYFKDRTAQLIQLKDDYTSYILALKKLITERSIKDASQESVSDLIKNNSDNETQFVVVNREPAYLKESALSFARKYNLEWALEKLYAADEWVHKALQSKANPTKAKPKGRKSPSKRASSTSQKQMYDGINDKQLKSLQKEALFSWPLERRTFILSSTFGPRKKPNGTWGFHTGIDLAARLGTPVKAAGSGLIIEARDAGGYGNCIVIAHNRKFKTRYAHLSAIDVHVGDKVTEGQAIGKVGATGNVWKSKQGNGSHLHFEVDVFGKHVNPFYFLT